MRGVGELAELGREQVRGLLADVDRAVADALDRPRDDDHPQAPLAERGLGHHVDEPLDEAAVRAVDQLVELDEALGAGEVAAARTSRARRGSISSARSPISVSTVDERRIRIGVGDELRELRDRHAAVGAALEQQVDVQHREQQPQVARDRRLQREQRLDRALDRRGRAGRSRRRRRSPRRRARRRAPGAPGSPRGPPRGPAGPPPGAALRSGPGLRRSPCATPYTGECRRFQGGHHFVTTS